MIRDQRSAADDSAHQSEPGAAARQNGDAVPELSVDQGTSDWRTVCRRVARAAAEAEARTVWQVENGDEIPFNFRWEHVQHVVKTALWLADRTGADREVVEAAAWLHDVRKQEKKHAVAGAEAAQTILAATDFPTAKIEAVADSIRQHEGLSRTELDPLEPLEAAVLWDADKLTKLGVQALIYNLSGRRVQGNTLAQRRQLAAEFTTQILVRTVASMNTEPALSLAVVRYQAMLAVLEQWRHDELLEDELLHDETLDTDL